MPLFGPEDDARVRELLAKMERPVELVVAQGPEETPMHGAGDVDFGAETERIVRELCELSDLLTMRVTEGGDERYPAVAVLPEGRDMGVRYYGLPWGYELGSLIGAALEAGYAESTLSPESLERLAAHEGELAIDVFVTPT
jgi:alkyl hydroperoxide reductase subunit AhpF